ncbi:dihydrodipicolinate synthase family protein [Agrococcus sp. ARC_14]|uniref:dihydrodipicolinate synthase family protein n=1 Tax=Agrococcus sp. ARC_14 TaxID=2919927 RepID=UPI001F06BD7C|nr:dihydrodipicolinate synthase family protein [Agrococcus sp. ARC_14]MCH1883355.1 dihydrodipicolinate synthase family protein [Agrococcus sp. ARC_14]
MFTGLSAFPLTPLRDDQVDLDAFGRIITMLAGSGVDSITALGSTGSYAYLDRDERQRVVAAAVAAAGDTPVIAGIGALRTSHAIAYARDAVDAGAQAVLLAPLTYQALTVEDVYGFYGDVLGHLTVPLVVYDNPGTTHFTFTDELYGRLAALPGVASIKIPGLPAGVTAEQRVARIRDVVPERVTIGISGDPFAADALNGGCDAWYSVIAGTLPEPALRITRAALTGDAAGAAAESARLQPLWDLFAEHGGSNRVVAAIAEELGLAPANSLPLPIRGLDASARARLLDTLATLELR